MKTAWRNACILLAGALLAVTAGIWVIRSARQQARFPQQLETAKKALSEGGGEQGLLERQRFLSEMRARLALERAALDSDAATFSRRVEEVFRAVGITITASSDWQVAPEIEAGEGAAFERTFAGSGAFDALIGALHTIESWPDRARLHALSVVPGDPGTVAFTLEITVVRRTGSAAPGES